VRAQKILRGLRDFFPLGLQPQLAAGRFNIVTFLAPQRRGHSMFS